MKRLFCFLILLLSLLYVAGCSSVHNDNSDSGSYEDPESFSVNSGDSASGLPDVSVSDASTSDASTSDASTSDASTSDVFTSDASDGDRDALTSDTSASDISGAGEDALTSDSSGAGEDALTSDSSDEEQDALISPSADLAGGESEPDASELSELIISEAISSNSSYMKCDGAYYDMVELYNSSDHDIELSDYYLSDKLKKPDRYRLPQYTLQAGGYYVVYCSGLDIEGHAPFKISADGETIYLTDGSNILDMLELPADLETDKSYGRYDGQNVYMEIPTFGQANLPGYVSRVSVPIPSCEPGLYEDTVSLELESDSTVYYTLDGSCPTLSSAVYSEPISISAITTVRAFASDGERCSDLVSYTYIVGVSHTLPIVYVSLSDTDRDDIVVNYSDDIEKECIFTLYEDGEVKFAIPCGLKLHGNDSRRGAKQNFQLHFRSQYGCSKLEYRLFDELDIDEFDSLLLKGGSEDYLYANMRDELMTGIVNGTTNLSVLACKPCILYLGSSYWGIYYLRENFSDDYVASHFDVPEDSVDLLFYNGGEQSGSADAYIELKKYARTHDLTIDEYYQYVIGQIDPVSLMDWYICRSYMGDKDYANMRFFRSTAYDSKWRWMYFDLDWAFYSVNDKPLKSIITDTDQNALIYNLIQNDDFKDMFLKRYAELMGTILNEEYISSQIDRYVQILTPEIAQDRERWGCTVSDWEKAVNKLYAYVKDGKRNAHVQADIKSYFGLSDEEMEYYFGN